MNRNAAAFLTLVVLSFLFSRAMTYASTTPAAKIKKTAKAAKAKSVKSHTQCSRLELERRDCHLLLKPYDVRISRLKVTWFDGTWTNIADAPMSDEKNEWDKMALEKIEDRLILQFWIWDAGKGEAKVQSLHWIVGEFKDKNFVTRLDQIVRKREVKNTQPVSYTYDRPIPHSLKKTKSGVQWTVGHDSGSI